MKQSKFLLCFLMIILCIGCGDRVALTSQELKDIAMDNGFSVNSTKDQYAEYADIKEAYMLFNSDGATLEFYILDSVTNAKNMYDSNKEQFSAVKGPDAQESNYFSGNYKRYVLTSGGTYMYLSQIDNTVLFVSVSSKYRDSVDTLIEKMEY